MNFQTAVKTCLLEKYATFSGRASRPEYWWFILAYVIGAIVFSLLGIWLLYALYVLALIVPVTAAGFRRLQDTGRPGWYILIPVAVGLIGTFLLPTPMAVGPGGEVSGMPGAGTMMFGGLLAIVQLVLAILFIWWLTRPSQPEANEYGPPPQA